MPPARPERTVPDLVHAAALAAPDRVAVDVVGGPTVTFAELADRVARAAGALHRAGVGRGDRVAVMARNGLTVFDAYLGAAQIGAAAVPVGPDSGPALVSQIVADARPAAGVADTEHTEALGGANFPLVDLSEGAPAAGIAEPDDVAIVIYTSGTTGSPAGVCLSNTAVVHNAEITVAAQGLGPEDIYLSATPMSHTAAAMRVFTMLRAQATHVVMERFDAGAWLVTVADRGITTTIAVPTQLHRILEHDGFDQESLQSMRLLLYGAAPSSPRLSERMRSMLPCDLSHGYGLTEAAGLVTALDPRDHARLEAAELATAVGRPLPGIALRIVDAAGRDMTAGAVGEILVQTDKVMSGYWERPEETADALRDGWLVTGDLGSIDDAGRLSLAGRRTDVIISGGVSIHPEIVERAIASLPGVAAVAVAGLPDPEWGEIVAAFVIPSAGAEISGEQIAAHAGKLLGPTMRPRRIEVVARLPRTDSGKVRRRELVERFR